MSSKNRRKLRKPVTLFAAIGRGQHEARSVALSELATVCGAYAFAVLPSIEMRVRFVCAKKQCRNAGMTEQEIEKAILEFGEIARKAIRKTFS